MTFGERNAGLNKLARANESPRKQEVPSWRIYVNPPYTRIVKTEWNLGE